MRLVEMRRNSIYFLLLIILPLNMIGQTTVKLKEAGSLTLVKIDGQSIQRLVDSVWLVQGNTNIYCDSAYLNKQTNSAQAFGHVKIIDTVDIIDIKADYLKYDGNVRKAFLRDNVVLKDDSATLYTDKLDYDRITRIGTYFDGGKLIDPTSILTSKRGFYNYITKESEFYDSVRMTNDEFYLETDTLFYNTINTDTRSIGKTLGVTQDADTLKTNTGLFYNRQKKYAEVYKGRIFNTEFDIEADTLITDDSLKLYKAYQNITMVSKEDSLTIFGDKAKYDKLNNTAIAYENAYLRKMMQGDSLFIRADTLFSDQSDPDNKFLKAYHDVRLFKSNLQGIADSMSYNFSDSTIFMYQDPVIWANDSQLSADSINIEIKNNKVDKMNLAIKSFVISQDSTKNFNQISGKLMQIHFEEGIIQRTDVTGNGESIYYVLDDNGALSMNKLKCSNMILYFEDNTVAEIRTYQEVDAQLIPGFKILPIDRRLRGFNWRTSEKPKLRDIARHLRYDR
ncbi:OstA-like protein [Roseivirga sp.]|uniref:OstA-like protein n=1 Tax=Roseivirga sp. TaxID=1964215 RepID=UPI003B8CC309